MSIGVGVSVRCGVTLPVRERDRESVGVGLVLGIGIELGVGSVLVLGSPLGLGKGSGLGFE